MLKKRNGILRKNRGKGIENLTYPYMGAGGVKNFQNHPYVINEWPLRYMAEIGEITQSFIEI